MGTLNAETNSVQSKKSAFDKLLEQLIKVQAKKRFQNFEIINKTIRCEFDPNEEVMVSINIWNAKELWVRIVFRKAQENVEIEDKSFGKYSAELKVKRLQNVIVNLGRMPETKEDLFPGVRDWKKFSNCNYNDIFFVIFKFKNLMQTFYDLVTVTDSLRSSDTADPANV